MILIYITVKFIIYYNKKRENSRQFILGGGAEKIKFYTLFRENRKGEEKMKKTFIIMLTVIMIFSGNAVYASSEIEGTDNVKEKSETENSQVDSLSNIETSMSAPQLFIYDKCKVDYNEVASVNNHVIVEVTLTNEEESSVNGWSLVYNSDADIVSSSGVEVVIGDQGIHYLSNSEYNAEIPSRSTVSFNLTLSCDNNYVTPTEFRVYGCEARENVNAFGESDDGDVTDIFDDFTYEGGDEGTEEEFPTGDSIYYDLDTQKYIFDTTEEEEIPDYKQSYTPGKIAAQSEATSSFSPFTILGNDGRVKVNNPTLDPYSKIAALTIQWPNGNISFGTGFMVSENCMLTAGHCVYSLKYGKPAAKIKAYFGLNGASYSYVYNASKVFFSGDLPKGRTWQNDWGVVKFNKNIGNNTGWFGLGYLSDEELLSKKVRVAGYPGDHMTKKKGAPDGYLRYMYRASNPVRTVGLTYLTYYTDTFKGQSGSPVYGINDIFVSGIHHSQNVAGTCNVGRRINKTIFNFWIKKGFIHF